MILGAANKLRSYHRHPDYRLAVLDGRLDVIADALVRVRLDHPFGQHQRLVELLEREGRTLPPGSQVRITSEPLDIRLARALSGSSARGR